MNDFEAAQKTLDAEIEQLDADIAQCRSRIDLLESKKVELKSRRNTFAPIGRLPPELIVKIFSCTSEHLSSTELTNFRNYCKPRAKFVAAKDLEEARAKDAIHQRLLRPSVLTLCHVSHGWRLLSLENRDLWSSIQVQLRTSPEVLKFMWRNAGGAMKEVDITGMQADLAIPNPEIFVLLYTLIQRGTAKLKSLGIYCCATQFLSALRGRAEHLESLTIVAEPPVVLSFEEEAAVVYDNVIFEGGAPNLRRLKISSLAISWTSSILLSPSHLTHVMLDYPPRPTPKSVAEFLHFLRRSPHLITLDAQVDMPYVDEGMDYFLTLVPDRSPIQLSKLTTLDLGYGHPAPMSAFLSLLHIPRDISSLTLVSGDMDPEFAETILEFATFGRNPSEYIMPEEVYIGSSQAKCWKKSRFEWKLGHSGASRRRLSMLDKPVWMNLQVTNPTDEDAFDPTAYRLPWSFTNLRSISISRQTVPRTFWAILADLKDLEVIQIGEDAESFLLALSREPETPAILTTSNSARAPSGVFPALKAVWFTELGERGVGSLTAFVSGVADAFSKRERSALLEELAFVGCGGNPVDEIALDILSPVTRCVVWDEAVFILQNLVPSH